MLRTLLQMKMPYYIARQERAPLLRQREAFLEHLLQQGTSIAAARMVAWQLLNVIELLDLTRLRGVGIDEIQAAGKRWARRQRANPLAHSYNRSASYFVYVAKKWLGFAGVLKVPSVIRMRYADELDDFAKWMAEECSLAAMTVRGRRNRVLLFLRWLSGRRQSLAQVRIRDLDDYLISQGSRGFSRKTLNSDADALRTFFRYGEQRGWTRPSIAEGIISPRIYAQEGLPEGPEWKEVKRMLAGAVKNKASALRARAILLLLAIYGLRCGEVCRLQLSDFDWRAETFTGSSPLLVNHGWHFASGVIGVRTESGFGDVPRRLWRSGRCCRMPAKSLWIDCKCAVGTGSLWCCGRLRKEVVVPPARVSRVARIAGTSGSWAICRGKAFRLSLNCMCAVSFATTTNAVNIYLRSDSEKRLRVTPGAPLA
jgi:integrase